MLLCSKSDVFITRCVVRVIRVISLYRFKTLYAIDVNVNSGVECKRLRYLDRFFVVVRLDYFGTSSRESYSISHFPFSFPFSLDKRFELLYYLFQEVFRDCPLGCVPLQCWDHVCGLSGRTSYFFYFFFVFLA